MDCLLRFAFGEQLITVRPDSIILHVFGLLGIKSFNFPFRISMVWVMSVQLISFSSSVQLSLFVFLTMKKCLDHSKLKTIFPSTNWHGQSFSIYAESWNYWSLYWYKNFEELTGHAVYFIKRAILTSTELWHVSIKVCQKQWYDRNVNKSLTHERGFPGKSSQTAHKTIVNKIFAGFLFL